MRKILLSTTNDDESRLAVINNGRLTDYLSVVTGQEDRSGSIFCGIVAEVEPALDACFVDIGDSKKGFLKFSDIHEDCLLDKEGDTAERLSKGQPILVQIVKDSRSKKGPMLSTRIKIQSNHLLLMPWEKDPDGLRVSRKATDSERDRLLQATDILGVGDNMTMIVRSNGLDKAVEVLAWEKRSLITLWNLILKIHSKQEKPTLIYEYRNISNICLYEYLSPDTEELLCDSPETERDIRDLLTSMGSEMIDRVRCVENDETLFTEMVLKQIDALLSRRVGLPSGGELIIDNTEALVAIDVNSGRSRGQRGIEATALKTNLEAASEVATQLKLRNLSGIIVIDFIDMENSSNREKLENHFRRALRIDRAQTSLGKLSKFGLMEMTRQYIGRSLHESHSIACEHCDGRGRVPTIRILAISILDKIQDMCINRKKVGSIYAELPIDPATYILNEKRDEISRIKSDFGVDVIVIPSVTMHGVDHRIRVEKASLEPSTAKPSYQQHSSTNKQVEQFTKSKKSAAEKATAAITGVVSDEPHPVKEQQEAFSMDDDEDKNGNGNTKPKQQRQRKSSRRQGKRQPKGERRQQKPRQKASENRDTPDGFDEQQDIKATKPDELGQDEPTVAASEKSSDDSAEVKDSPKDNGKSRNWLLPWFSSSKEKKQESQDDKQQERSRGDDVGSASNDRAESQPSVTKDDKPSTERHRARHDPQIASDDGNNNESQKTSASKHDATEPLYNVGVDILTDKKDKETVTAESEKPPSIVRPRDRGNTVRKVSSSDN